MANFFDGQIDRILAERQSQIELERLKQQHAENKATEEQRKAEELRTKVNAKWSADLRIVEEIMQAINDRSELGVLATLTKGSPNGNHVMGIKLQRNGSKQSLFVEIKFSASHIFTIQDNPAGGYNEFMKYGREGYSHYISSLLRAVVSAPPEPNL